MALKHFIMIYFYSTEDSSVFCTVDWCAAITSITKLFKMKSDIYPTDTPQPPQKTNIKLTHSQSNYF